MFQGRSDSSCPSYLSLNGIVIFLYRLSGGRLAGRFGKAPILLLTTTGRKTGKLRTNPVLYRKDGENFAIVASTGGRDRDPYWWSNLQQNPEAEIQVGSKKIKVMAEKALDHEKHRLWPLLTEIYPTFDVYQRKTKREIPVVIPRPVGSKDSVQSSGHAREMMN
jgi:F420H(2)-dependent quinone reductase